MLLGTFYGIYVAIKGIRSRSASRQQNVLTAFQFGPVSPEIRKLIVIWGVIMFIGLLITAVGLSLGLK